jgi:hypothetical protein
MKIEQRRGGFYWKGNKPYLSVTTALQCIDKPALRYWFGKEIFYAMTKNPGMSEQDAMAAPYKVSDKAKSRGSTIHSIVEAYKSSGDRIEHIVSPFREYAIAFYEFMEQHQVKVISQEKTLLSEEYKIAGTLDMYCEIGGVKYIVDVKTGKDIYQEAGLQLSAYAQMMREAGEQVDEIAVLLLETGKDGLPTSKYKFQTMTEDFISFRAAKRLYCYLNKEKITKLGYGG